VVLETSPQLHVRKLLVFADGLILVFALAAAVFQRVYLAAHVPLRGLPPVRVHVPEYVILALLTLPLWLGLASKLDLYAVLDRAWTFRGVAVRLAQHHMLGLIVVSTLVYATQVVLNRSLVLLFMGNSFVAMLGLRAALLAWRRHQYRKGLGRLRLLLVGAPSPDMLTFAERSTRQDYPPLVLGFLDPRCMPDTSESPGTSLPCLGSIGDLDQVLHEHPVDHVLFFPPCDRANQIEPAMSTCESRGVPCLIWVNTGSPTGAAAQITSLWDAPFIFFELAPKRPDLLALKHAFDFVAASVGILLLAPLFIGVALAILVADGRPVFFRQARAGFRGRPFHMLKFRTMEKDADQRKAALADRNEMDGPVFKIAEDPRVTRLGGFLRKTSIDELPQLFHVVSGRMSLVGPRPLPLAEQRELRGWHRRRLAMRPGISGLWQVSGRSNLGFEKWMELDLKYVDEWSLWLDVKILVKTVPVVLWQRGAR
jgi:exopolysaccharide biosynthesis polyprenyl glycosylphosphotransferase